MNGQWIGSRAIRTNWASRKPNAPNNKESKLKCHIKLVYFLKHGIYSIVLHFKRSILKPESSNMCYD